MNNSHWSACGDCEEFEYDGDDCNLVDCMETRFSDEFCFSMFGAGCTTTTNIFDSTMYLMYT